MCMVIALGYGASQGTPHRGRSFADVTENAPSFDWFLAGVDAAMKAPTAVNQQKFRFILHPGDVVEAKALMSFAGYTDLDLGIVKYHFEAGAGKENFSYYPGTPKE